MLCSIDTHLNDDALSEIRSLERKLSTPLLAFSCHQIEPADVSEDGLSQIRELESRLGISLVAVAA